MDSCEGLGSAARQFDDIAFLYDEVMAGVPYSQWADYVQRLLTHFGSMPRTVLDLCCGTGSVALEFAERGYSVSGADISSAMVEIARQRAGKAGLFIDYHVQSASELHLSRRFDLVLSLFDSLNYVVESSELQQVFYRAAEHLEPAGLFVFDMNSEYAFTTGLFTQSNAGCRARVTYDWRSSYDRVSHICRIDMRFDYHSGAEQKSVQVTHYQRAYDTEEILNMLAAAGLEVRAVYHAYTLKRATTKSDRVFYVASRPRSPL